jgi:hypothetical protein
LLSFFDDVAPHEPHKLLGIDDGFKETPLNDHFNVMMGIVVLALVVALAAYAIKKLMNRGYGKRFRVDNNGKLVNYAYLINVD